MSKPKVLHISTAKTWRGGEQQIAYLMEELRRKDIEQYAFCTANGAFLEFCQKNNFVPQAFKKGFSANPFVAKKLSKTVDKWGINIIHCHDSHAHTFAYMAARFFGVTIPIVVSRRVDFPIKNTKRSHRKYKHSSIKRILCVSDQIKAIVKKDIPDKGHIHTVYSGVDLDKFKDQSDDLLRKEYNISAQTPVIVNVGALADHKDHITFLETIHLIQKQVPGLKAFIIGKDQGEQRAILDRIKDLKLEDHVHLTGFRTDIPKILPHANLFLFTSKTEGLGTSILDAFASKIPVVATPAGGIPELVINEQTGLLGKIKDPESLAMLALKVLNNKFLAADLINGANQHAQNFSKEQTAIKTLEHYEDLL